VVSFTAEIGFKIISNMILWKSLSCGGGHIRFPNPHKKKIQITENNAHDHTHN
jgi:hypothetical protein